jgi:hypothetical protein
MAARLCLGGGTQASSSDGGSGVDVKLPGENRRKQVHDSHGNALAEARLFAFAADEAGSNDGQRSEPREGDVPLDLSFDSWIKEG